MIRSRSLFLVTLGILASVAMSCKGPEKAAPPKPERPTSVERDRALQHFIQGSVYEQKGEYAKAILEYQDALRYDKDPAIYYALSKNYSIVGKHTLAIQTGREAVALAPANRTYRENLAEVYFNAFEIDSAIAQYHKVVELDPYHAAGWYSLARLYQMRNPSKSLEVYESILERFGSSWEVLYHMAAINTSLGRMDEAARILSELLTLDPANVELRRMLADTYLRMGKINEAVLIYTDFLENHPDDLEARAGLAHAYLLQGDYDLAAEQLRWVVQSDTVSVDTQLQFGEFFASFLQTDTLAAPYAMEIFESIGENFPGDWRPFWFMGIIANIMHNDSAAIVHMKRVTELAPTNPDGWVYLSSIYLDNNQFEIAAQILREASVRIPNEFRIHFLLGLSHQRLKQLEDAEKSLALALQLKPEDISALSSLALVYDELKRHTESDSLYEKALAIDPHYHLVLNNYAYSLAERDTNLERALAMATEAVRQQPENSSYLDTIGWVYYKLGQYDEAEKFIRKAIEKGDASPVVIEHLGDVYFKLNQTEKAMEYWLKALEQDADNTELRGKIQRGGL